jgi:DNA-binding GntR family transcriptional regulator
VARSIESLRTQVYRLMKQDILMGQYGAGEQLPVEELAKKYEISNTPVKEALTLLQGEGLVEIVPRIGYFTARFTVAEIQELFEVRILLETGAAKLAAKRIAEHEVLHLEHMQATYVAGDPSTYLAWIQYNREFHYRIALASRNSELAKMIVHVLDRLQRAQWLRLDLPPTPKAAMAGHHKLIQALRQSDPDCAENAMLEDIIVSRDAAMKRIAERPGEWLD